MSLIDDIYWKIPYGLRNAYYNLRDFFSPRQKWLTKKIGRSWQDKTELIKIVAFESIVHFIEEEKAFEKIEWSATEGHTEAAKAFKKAYNIVRLKLPILENRKELLWKDINIENYLNGSGMNPSQKESFESIRVLESEIEKLEQEVIETVAKYRNYMWT